MKAITRLYVSVMAGLILVASGFAQDRCSNAPDYFEPVLSGDGQRYPLTIGPLVWHLLGSGVYPVKASDGPTHLAFAMQFTNAWSQPATIQSVEVLDPAKNYKANGKSQVLSIKEESVTGMVKLSSLPSTLDKASYSSKIAGDESGVMFFDGTYADSNEVPCTIALRVHAVQPENKHLPESTVVSPPLKVSTRAAIILSAPFKGVGGRERVLPGNRATSIRHQSDEWNAGSVGAICDRLDQGGWTRKSVSD